MALSDKSPQDLFGPWGGKYENELNAIWWQVVQMDSCKYILERIAEVPTRYMGIPPHHFWELVVNVFAESCILTLWRIGVDADNDILSLQGMKKRMICNFVEAGDKAEFIKQVKNRGFERLISEFENEVREIRNNYIGHFNYKRNVGDSELDSVQQTLTAQQLRAWIENVKEALEILTIYGKRLTVPIQYSNIVDYPPGYDGRSDIVKLLDMILLSSDLLNAPEKQPLLWQEMIKGYDAEQLNNFNEMRARIKLPMITK